MKRYGSVCAGFALVAMMAVSVCAQGSGPIKIGCVFSITGGASFLGEPEAQTARMVAEEVNAAGGINGRPIELLVEDTQGGETQATNAVKKLIRANVVAIIGPSRSGCTMAVKKICNSSKVPLISCAAAEVITSSDAEWIFKTPHKDSHAVQRIYDYMVAHGMKSVALMTGTTGFGAAGRKQLIAIAEDYPSIKIVADETYAPADKDMTAQLTKIKAKKPDAIVNWSIVPAQSLVLKNKDQLGMGDIQFFQSHGFGNIKYVEAAGKSADGVIFPASRLLAADDLLFGHPHRGMLQEYKHEYEAKYKTHVSSFGGHALDALHLVMEACQEKGATRQDIRDYIENRKNFLGTAGLYNFSPDDHTGLTKDSFEMLSVKDGAFIVAPE